MNKDIECYSHLFEARNAGEWHDYIYILLGEQGDFQKQLLRRGVSSGRGTDSLKWLFWVSVSRAEIVGNVGRRQKPEKIMYR